MRSLYDIKGYRVGATVRQYHHNTMYSDAVITRVHLNGALDVEINGIKYGWSTRTCKPVNKLNFEDWLELNDYRITVDAAESGMDRELCYDREKHEELEYEKYIESEG